MGAANSPIDLILLMNVLNMGNAVIMWVLRAEILLTVASGFTYGSETCGG